jgi:hypothetical protein
VLKRLRDFGGWGLVGQLHPAGYSNQEQQTRSPKRYSGLRHMGRFFAQGRLWLTWARAVGNIISCRCKLFCCRGLRSVLEIGRRIGRASFARRVSPIVAAAAKGMLSGAMDLDIRLFLFCIAGQNQAFGG